MRFKSGGVAVGVGYPQENLENSFASPQADERAHRRTHMNE